MRRLVLLSTLSVFCLGIVHCVDSAPGDTANGGDASTDQDATTGGNDAAAGGDGSTKNDSGSTDSGIDAAPPPPNDSCVGHTDCPDNVESSNLQIWLRSNIGLTCTSGRVAAWTDQSTHANNAGPPTYIDAGPATPPQCGVTKLNTHDVVTFTAPAEPDGGNNGFGSVTQYVDETLNTNLSWVGYSNYTIFVVHRRAADTAAGLVGQDYDFTPTNIFFSNCFSVKGQPPAQPGLSFGYEGLADGGEGLVADQMCGSTTNGLNDTYVASTPIVDEVVFSQATGHALFTNGAPVFIGSGAGADLEVVTNNDVNGVIGRSFDRYTTDARYKGEIAEIIGYNIALSDSERAQIEAYLKRQWALTF